MEGNNIMLINSKSDVCRVCLRIMEKTELLDLNTIYDEESQLDYNECFRICTQIDLRANTNLPQNLCKSCGFELQITYNFYKKVEESKKFLEYYQQDVSEDIENDSMQILAKHQNNNADDDDDDDDMELVTQDVESIEEEGDEVEEFNNNSSNNYQSEQIYTVVELAPTASETCEFEINNQGLPESMDQNLDIDERLGIEEFQYIEALDGEVETEMLNMKCNSSAEYLLHADVQEILPDNDKLTVIDVPNVVNEEKDEFVNNDDDHDHDPIDNPINNNNNKTMINHVNEIQTYMPGATFTDLQKTEDNRIDSIDSEATTANGFENEVQYMEKSNEITITKRQRRIGLYACDYCQKTFPNYSRMSIHRRSHEVNRPKHTCDSCGRMYCTKQALEVHVRTIHTKSGYTCTICNKIFAIKKSLEVHIRYHTGDFPYVCDICGKKFAQMCHLNTHRNVKHNSVRFGCDYPDCGKFFTSSHSLRNHEFSHSMMPFECEFCQQGYPAKAKLKVHIKRKHGRDMNKDELEKMRKFYVMRSRVNCVKVIEVPEEI